LEWKEYLLLVCGWYFWIVVDDYDVDDVVVVLGYYFDCVVFCVCLGVVDEVGEYLF